MGFGGSMDSAMSRQDKLGRLESCVAGGAAPFGKDDIAVFVRMIAEGGGDFGCKTVSLSLQHGRAIIA
jgi:hypothetical protein